MGDTTIQKVDLTIVDNSPQPPLKLVLSEVEGLRGGEGGVIQPEELPVVAAAAALAVESGTAGAIAGDAAASQFVSTAASEIGMAPGASANAGWILGLLRWVPVVGMIFIPSDQPWGETIEEEEPIIPPRPQTTRTDTTPFDDLLEPVLLCKQDAEPFEEIERGAEILFGGDEIFDEAAGLPG